MGQHRARSVGCGHRRSSIIITVARLPFLLPLGYRLRWFGLWVNAIASYIFMDMVFFGIEYVALKLFLARV